MAKGTIGVTTENIFPVIKKFLYSDQEIFLRELVSNAVDATRKLKTLSAFGDFKGELGDTSVRVIIDREAGTLTVSDHGIGMDAADIEKYINQIAFSGAEEFLAKYKDTANSIIGHFGLGFYSAFMVSKKVVIRSLSYKEGAKAVEWECDGSPEFEMRDIEKAERGTDIILYIDDESKEYLEQMRIDTLLKKYCRFLPVPVISGFKQEWKDGKMVDTDTPNVVNATEPLWTRKPADLTDADYLKFYRELQPGQEDPMFWIHLNVDYPFTLTGILYFPKVKSQIDIQKNRIQLYCNQVYVTDQVEGVLPEFMTIMQGVIDSPDIPLNVSRSYLQSDRQVKQIAGYTSKKMAEKLASMFKDDRAAFESKWDDIKIFVEYGMLTDQKFYDAASKFFLLRDTDGKYYTLEQYHTLVEGAQTDKDGQTIYIYATDPKAQYAYIKEAQEKGYNILLMDGQLDQAIIGLLESKLEKTRFVSVDSDTADRIIPKEGNESSGLDTEHTDMVMTLFRTQIPEVEGANFMVDLRALNATAAPATVTRDEYMRRMKEMAAMQPAAAMFGQLPDSYNLNVNTAQGAVARIIASATEALKAELTPLNTKIDALNAEITKARSEAEERKETPDTTSLEADAAGLRTQKEDIIRRYADSQPEIRQIIDLALLRAGLLQGKALSDFIDRSTALL